MLPPKRRVYYILSTLYNAFKENQIQLNSATLTYYTLLSLIPIFTLLLVIGEHFSFQESVVQWITTFFKDQPSISEYLITFTRNSFKKTQATSIKVVGIAILVWTTLKMLVYIDISINQLWNRPFRPSFLIRKARFLIMLISCPLLFFLSSGLSLYLGIIIKYLSLHDGVLENIANWLLIASHLFPSLLMFLLLSFLYYFVPYVKVSIKDAMLAALITSIAYQLVQYGYFAVQISVTSYSVIYGTFAAFPLFLMWIHMSWVIFLMGARLCYSLGIRV